jgi:hypothetical protein
MSPDLPAQLPAPFKNRRGWLIFFGVIEILIACLCLLLVALTATGFVAMRSAPTGAPALSAAGAVMAVLFYAAFGVLFLILGAGSIERKNWARVGSQIASGFWLFIGAFSSLFLAFILPKSIEQQSKVPIEQLRPILFGMGLFMIVLMVLLPATLLVFYSLGSVRATCLATGVGQGTTIASTGADAGQPPVSVILLALWECFGALSVLSLIVARANVVFGVVVRGPSAILLMAVNALLCGIAAWLIYHRDYLGWAISLFKTLFWTASWIVTILTRNLIDIYRQMGFSDQQLQLVRQLPRFQSVTLVSIMSGLAVFWILLLYTKKFFSRAGTGTESDRKPIDFSP